MRVCGNDCFPLCDSCKHYAFNGEPVTGTDGTVAMVYVGKGRCNLHNRHEEPEGRCDDFYCCKAAKVDEAEAKRHKDSEGVTESLTRLWVEV